MSRRCVKARPEVVLIVTPIAGLFRIGSVILIPNCLPWQPRPRGEHSLDWRTKQVKASLRRFEIVGRPKGGGMLRHPLQSAGGSAQGQRIVLTICVKVAIIGARVRWEETLR
jgi:hypothetical protein